MFVDIKINISNNIVYMWSNRATGCQTGQMGAFGGLGWLLRDDGDSVKGGVGDSVKGGVGDSVKGGVDDRVRVMGGHVYSTAVQDGSRDTEWSEMETV